MASERAHVPVLFLIESALENGIQASRIQVAGHLLVKGRG